MADQEQDPDSGLRFPVIESCVAYWSRTIQNELTEAEAVTDAQYIRAFVSLELSLHQGRDWRNKTSTELKADFMLWMNFITPI